MNPESLQIHCILDDWEDLSTAIDNDEPPLQFIDNPV